jgi:predicted ATPase/DNA-binding winged helix-turn-helix (wHTH) protein
MTQRIDDSGDRPIGFGPFQLYPAARILKKNLDPVDIGGRAFDILVALLRRPNEIVTKRELFELVWPNIHVDDGSLRTQITYLRKALGEGEGEARYIRNVAGRGYCFVGTVTTGSPGAEREKAKPWRAHALPLPPPKIVGRDEVIRQISSQLLEHRFVSIVGPGGIGKTTVAAAVVEATAAEFDNVHFLDLSPLGEPGLVTSALASSLGIPVNTSTPLAAMLVALNSQHDLVVFDCCEHVIDDVAQLAGAIYQEAKRTYILATTRESLRIGGERIYRLRPLECPPDGQTMSAAETLAYPAVELFSDRLVASGAVDGLTDSTLSAVGEICRRLDGIALALELVAGRVETYGIQGIASLLDNQATFHLRGRRGASPRQQTLSATLDWSYDLLTEVERSVLRRLSLFVGRFSLEAAQVVAAGGAVDGWQVVESIDNLVTKSLASFDPTGPTLRYRLLDTTRRYLHQRLEASGEAAEVSRRHAIYYRDLLTRAGPERANAEGSTSQSDHISNVRAALDWCFSPTGEAAIGVELAAAAAYLFLEKSLLSECRIWMKKAAAAFESDAAPTHDEMEIRTSLALSLMFTEGNTIEAHTAFERGLQLAEVLGETAHQLRLLSGLQLFLARVGKFKDSLEVARRSEAISDRMPDRESSALAAAMVGTAYHLAGDQAAAETYCKTAYERPPFAGDMLFAQFGYDNRIRAFGALARVLWLRGFPNQAVAMVNGVLERARPLDPISNCISMMFTVSVSFWMGDWKQAGALVERLIVQSDKHSLHPYRAVGTGLSGKLQVYQGQRDVGIKLLRESLDILRVGRHHVLALPLTADLSEALAAAGNYIDAQALIDAIVDQDEQNGGSWYTPELLRIRGVILASIEGAASQSAQANFRQALSLARQQSALSWELRIAINLARNSCKIGKMTEATKELGAIYDRFTEGYKSPDLMQAAQLLQIMRAAPSE